ncbi:MAG: hypothetical protein ACXVDN_20630 [Ktedonobacteraceae bacterium]
MEQSPSLSRHTACQDSRYALRFSALRVYQTGTREPSDLLGDAQHQGNTENHCLAKAISDVGWGELVRQLAYKAK